MSITPPMSRDSCSHLLYMYRVWPHRSHGWQSKAGSEKEKKGNSRPSALKSSGSSTAGKSKHVSFADRPESMKKPSVASPPADVPRRHSQKGPDRSLVKRQVEALADAANKEAKSKKGAKTEAAASRKEEKSKAPKNTEASDQKKKTKTEAGKEVRLPDAKAKKMMAVNAALEALSKRAPALKERKASSTERKNALSKLADDAALQAQFDAAGMGDFLEVLAEQMEARGEANSADLASALKSRVTKAKDAKEKKKKEESEHETEEEGSDDNKSKGSDSEEEEGHEDCEQEEEEGDGEKPEGEGEEGDQSQDETGDEGEEEEEKEEDVEVSEGEIEGSEGSSDDEKEETPKAKKAGKEAKAEKKAEKLKGSAEKDLAEATVATKERRLCATAPRSYTIRFLLGSRDL